MGTGSKALDSVYNGNIGGTIYDPKYGDLLNYPESLVIGDQLFPMLFIYYYDEKSGRKVDREKLKEGLIQLTKDIIEYKGGKDTKYSEKQRNDYMADFLKYSSKWRRAFEDGVNKNPTFLWQLANTVVNLMNRYKTRIPSSKGEYYQKGTGKNKKFSYFPMIEANSPDALYDTMETLKILYENDIIGYDHKIGIRPINLFTGDFAKDMRYVIDGMETARMLGLPGQGLFTVNNMPKTSWMYHTFSGVDIKATASLNTTVSELSGLTSLSWSLHKGKTTQRPLGKTSPAGRASGSRTIAGTMIFALSDHHPLLDIIPSDYPVTNKLSILNDPRAWRPMMLADQIPPFDINLILTNEYGFASIVTLYGVEVMDESCVYGVDNLINELVIQYVAVTMDPIVQVELDENGFIDPYGLLQGGYSKFFEHREMVAQGIAYSDLEEKYEEYYDTVFDVLNRQRN